MSTGLPHQIQVKKAVANAMRLEGSLKIASLTRLSASLLKDEGEVSARLDFDRGADRRANVHGSLDADLVMLCQRCMSEMIHHAHVELALQLVPAEYAADSEEEAVEYSDDQLQVHELIEDEMILALPLVPMHENAQDCEQSEVPQSYLRHDEVSERNPFAALKQLKLNSTSTR